MRGGIKGRKKGTAGVPRLTKSSVPALVEGHGFEGRALALGAVVVRINVIGLYAPAGVVNLLSLTSSLGRVDAGRAADARAAGSARIGLGGGGHGGGARGAGRSIILRLARLCGKATKIHPNFFNCLVLVTMNF